ncbi:uncharacterized protein LOC108670003 [Hyalella azteca]|uniref:Uncharacterized protein LOC108670003 n=1 Tax=Hyalella azteca TaxID=294128 RepID=A0A8B7NHU0_HYAAZ|nr:uncharacterized protein LOC108670003 [Hyalella azteca]
MKFAAAILLILLACSSALSPDVQRLCDAYWDWRMSDRPEFATFVGFNGYNANLDDLSLTAYENRLKKSQEFLDEILVLEPTLVETSDVVNLLILKDEVETFIAGYPFMNFLEPISYMEGPQVDLEKLISWTQFNAASDYEDYVARISKLDVQIQQIIELLSEGVARGILPHQISMNGVTEQIDAFIVEDPEECILFSHVFSSPSENLSPQELDDLKNRTKAVILETVVPSFTSLKQYISTQYSTRPDIAISTLPNGTELYRQLIIFHTGEDTTPDFIHQVGLSEVERINGLMQAIVYELGYNMTSQEFSEMIKNDPANFYETGEELMDQFENIVYNIVIPALPLAFDNIPKTNITVVESPSPDQPVAFYQSGSYTTDSGLACSTSTLTTPAPST